MTMVDRHAEASAAVRQPAVAGAFYPDTPGRLAPMARALLAIGERIGDASRPTAASTPPVGLLVPHAGLAFSGVVAASAWSRLKVVPDPSMDVAPDVRGPGPTVVILGTNHRAAWLNGIAAWPDGSWHTPLGPVPVDEELASAILELGPPFTTDRLAHLGEHSIEVQLPLLQLVAPEARIVPLSVATSVGPAAQEAGRRLGHLLASRRAEGQAIVLAISSDMAHYPAADACEAVTEALLPSILAVHPAGLAARDSALRDGHIPDLVCGMCGIEPAVVGLAALRELGALRAVRLAAATSADESGPSDRTVGYLAVAFDR